MRRPVLIGAGARPARLDPHLGARADAAAVARAVRREARGGGRAGRDRGAAADHELVLPPRLLERVDRPLPPPPARARWPTRRSGFFSAQVLGLALLGLTSVYREGFETVLFLQSLELSAGTATVLEGAGPGPRADARRRGAHVRAPAQAALQEDADRHRRAARLRARRDGRPDRAHDAGHRLAADHARADSTCPYWAGLWFGVFPTWETLGAQVGALVFVIGSYFLAQEVKVKRPRRKRRRVHVAGRPGGVGGARARRRLASTRATISSGRRQRPRRRVLAVDQPQQRVGRRGAELGVVDAHRRERRRRACAASAESSKPVTARSSGTRRPAARARRRRARPRARRSSPPPRWRRSRARAPPWRPPARPARRTRPGRARARPRPARRASAPPAPARSRAAPRPPRNAIRSWPRAARCAAAAAMPRPVLGLDPGERAAGAGLPRHDRRQAGRLEHGEARVVALDVGEHEAVDAPGRGEPLVGAGLRRRARAAAAARGRAATSVRSSPERKRTKNASVSSSAGSRASTRPTARARASVSARACALGRQPSSSAARRIRARVSSPTPGRSLTANETAAGETPARRATSSIVGRLRGVESTAIDRVTSRRLKLKRFSLSGGR